LKKLDFNKLSGEIKELLRTYGLESVITIKEVNTRNDFYDKNETIWDQIENNESGFDLVEINKIKWLLSEYKLRTDFCIGDVDFIYDLICDLVSEAFSDCLEESTLNDLEEVLAPNEYQEIYNEILNKIEELDFDDIEDILEPLFGISYPDEELDPYDALSYWPVFFKPRVEDEDIAWEVGLVPFYYEGEMYLALGGCGMDLSPKLDAYQALAGGTIPESSKFIRQPEYARYVVGFDIFDKVMEKIKCDPIIEIYTREAQ